MNRFYIPPPIGFLLLQTGNLEAAFRETPNPALALVIFELNKAVEAFLTDWKIVYGDQS